MDQGPIGHSHHGSRWACTRFASWGWLHREDRQALAGLALALDAGCANG